MILWLETRYLEPFRIPWLCEMWRKQLKIQNGECIRNLLSGCLKTCRIFWYSRFYKNKFHEQKNKFLINKTLFFFFLNWWAAEKQSLNWICYIPLRVCWFWLFLDVDSRRKARNIQRKKKPQSLWQEITFIIKYLLETAVVASNTLMRLQ